jgi:hypothetical protein
MAEQPLISDAAVWREHSQWRILFAPVLPPDDSGLLLANFGGCTDESVENEANFDSIIEAICDALSGDILQQIRGDLAPESRRGIRTASDGKPTKPVATPGQLRRAARTNPQAGSKARAQVGKLPGERPQAARSRLSPMPG